MGVTVRAIGADEWALARDLRLAALADAPDAFTSTLEGTRAIGDDEWRRRLAAADGSNEVVLVAMVDGAPAGLVRGAVGDDGVEITAMWVAPGARRRGAGAALLDALAEWARSRGARSATLFVAVTNEAALALYRKAGFEPTGERGILREGSGIEVIQLRAGL